MFKTEDLDVTSKKPPTLKIVGYIDIHFASPI